MAKPIILFPEEIAIVRKICEQFRRLHSLEEIRGLTTDEDTIDKLIKLGLVRDE